MYLNFNPEVNQMVTISSEAEELSFFESNMADVKFAMLGKYNLCKNEFAEVLGFSLELSNIKLLLEDFKRIDAEFATLAKTWLVVGNSLNLEQVKALSFFEIKANYQMRKWG